MIITHDDLLIIIGVTLTALSALIAGSVTAWKMVTDAKNQDLTTAPTVIEVTAESILPEPELSTEALNHSTDLIQEGPSCPLPTPLFHQD